MSRQSRIRNIIQELEEVCSSNNEIHFQYIENYYNNAETNNNTNNINRRNVPDNNIEEETPNNVADITVSLYENTTENNQDINESINNIRTSTNLNVNTPNSDNTSNTNTPDNLSGNVNNTTINSSDIQLPVRTIPINITDNRSLGSTIANSIDSLLNDLPNINNSELSVGANIFRLENLVPVHNPSRVQNGLTISELNEKTTIYINPTLPENDKCHICNELFTENCIFRKNIKCGHYFHQGCLDTWYAENHKCPICNQNIRE